MKNLSLIIIALAVVFLFSSTANAQDKKPDSKTKVTKEESCSSGESSCCGGTEEKTASTIKPYNEVCPVLGNKVNTSVKTVEYKGKVYGFCCAGCDDKFAKDPEKYLKNLDKDGKTFNKPKS